MQRLIGWGEGGVCWPGQQRHPTDLTSCLLYLNSWYLTHAPFLHHPLNSGRTLIIFILSHIDSPNTGTVHCFFFLFKKEIFKGLFVISTSTWNVHHSFWVHYWLCVSFVPYIMILKKHLLRPVCVSSKYSFGVANTVSGRVLSTVKVWVGEPGEGGSSLAAPWFWKHSFALYLGTCGTVQHPHITDQVIGALGALKGLLKVGPFVCKPAKNIWIPHQLFPI